MTQDSESVVVPRDQQRQLDAEQLMDAAGTLSRCGYGEDAEEVRAIALRLAAAPSTSVREEGLEAALRECAKPYFWDADGFWPDASTAAHKQAEMERRQRLALAALVPSTDEGKRHG